MGSIDSDTHYDVVVVGGGFCGVYQLQHLRKLGFKTRLFEAGSALGGIWHWNAYPGARVDTAVPTYQLTDPETFQKWDWKETFPGRDELTDYFRHLDKTWDLSKDISYNSRITSMVWDKTSSRWNCEINEGKSKCTAWIVVLCTGFASKRFVPDFKNLNAFKGEIYHTAVWPQGGVDLHNKRVAVIGTGASGVQVIQEVGKVASQLTVYQRTPNTALPMENPAITAAKNEAMRSAFPETKKAIETTFAGFDYEFTPGRPTEIPREDRMKLYESLYSTGGLHFWLGTYMDVLYQEEANEEAYQFWRAKVLPRINDPRVAEILVPAKKRHPFGTKRISLEQKYFEIFNQSNVELIDLPTNPIAEFTETGILSNADTTHREFDVVILATGFDSITGGITQIDIRGTNTSNPNNSTTSSIASHWHSGVYTHLGLSSSTFPNLFWTYGPQAPTAFATGPSSAETQGSWIIECIRFLHSQGYKTIEATREAEEQWRKHVNEIADKSLFPGAVNSWYFGANVPGKPREALNYMGGLPLYRRKLGECKEAGYEGFVLGR